MGFVMATGVLHGIGIAIGLIHCWPVGRIVLRCAGGFIAVMGVYFLWGALT
jgi:urease accessory protein